MNFSKSYTVESKVSKNDTTGLTNYGMSKFPGTQQLLFAGYNAVTGKFITGLDEFAPEVLSLNEAEREKKIKAIRQLVLEIESYIGKKGCLAPDSNFWDTFGVAFESINSEKSKIYINGQSFNTLEPATNPIHKLALVMLEANNHIPTSKTASFAPNFKDSKFFLYTEEEEAKESEASVNRDIQRGTELGKLFGDEVKYQRAWEIAYYLGYKPKKGVNEKILKSDLYRMTKDIRECDRFLKVCALTDEDLLVGNTFKKAVSLDIIKYNNLDKFYYRGGVNYRDTEEDSIEMLKEPAMAMELQRLKEAVDKKSTNRKNLS